MARERIISVDSHANIPEELIFKHLPKKFHDEFKESRLAAIQAALAGKPQKAKEGESQALRCTGDLCRLFCG